MGPLPVGNQMVSSSEEDWCVPEFTNKGNESELPGVAPCKKIGVPRGRRRACPGGPVRNPPKQFGNFFRLTEEGKEIARRIMIEEEAESDLEKAISIIKAEGAEAFTLSLPVMERSRLEIQKQGGVRGVLEQT